MTRFEKRLLTRLGLLGTLLTVFTAFIDRVGIINPLELFIDDFRAKHFQYFLPRPTDKLIHLDLDDNTLKFIGNWPWDRSIWARIINELYTSGAKVVDLDVTFPQAQKPTVEDPGEPAVDYDQLLADALKKFKSDPGRGVLLPVDVDLNVTPENRPIYRAMVEEISKNLEIEDVALMGRMVARQLDPATTPDIGSIVTHAKEEAMFLRVKQELDAGHPTDLESLRKTLLPVSYRNGIHSEAFKILQAVTPDVESFEYLLPFTRLPAPGLPPLRTEESEAAPIPKLFKEAGFSGYVNLENFDDAKIRCIPLWALDRGHMVPQMGLSLACAELGVSTNDLILTPESITIPLHDGNKIVIPVYTREGDRTSADGKVTSAPVGMVMDIPWFGTPDAGWLKMYDWPDHENSTQHIPMTKVWDVCQIDPEIVNNNKGALDDVCLVDGVVNSTEDAKRIRAHHPEFTDADGWNKLMSDTLDNLPPGTEESYKEYLDGTKDVATLTDPKEHDLVLAIRNLLHRPKENSSDAKQREDGRTELRRLFQGKAILIGMMASGTVDFRTTPLHKEAPGVVVHGAIFNAIVTGNFKYRVSAWVPVAFTLLVGLLVTFASAVFPPWRALISAALIAGIYLFLNFFVAYDARGSEIDAAGPPLVATLIWGVCTLTRFISEQKEKKRITGRFSSYVDPSLVNYLLEHPEKVTLEGENKELSVVFTDLQGFTTISELLKSETVALLNEYLGLMEPVIRKHRGLVNKFLGDGIMFFFGAPEPYPGDPNLHAWAAVTTVMEMQQVMVGFNERLAQRKLPVLRMRVGVSSGEVSVGDAGTPQRSDYTVLGDRVNFAARLESANKATGTLILVSDRTVELLADKFLVRPIGRLQVVGKIEPVMTYEPLAPIGEATDEMRKLVAMTQAVTENFIAANFADCLAATHELLQTFGDAQQGKFCALYRRLCLEYLQKPPKDFRGQIKLESK